jgi:hypothetical protein
VLAISGSRRLRLIRNHDAIKRIPANRSHRDIYALTYNALVITIE